MRFKPAVLALLAALACNVALAAGDCAYPVKAGAGTVVAADQDALRFFAEAKKNGDQATMRDYTSRGLVRTVAAGTSLCATSPTPHALYRIEVRLPDGEIGWVDEHEVTKVGWGQL